MIGGDAPYDEESGGGPAEGAPEQPPQQPQPPQSPQPSWPYQQRQSAEPAAPAPPEPTGDERVDAALARFDELAAAPVADHVEVFEDVQRRLQDVLAANDDEERPEPRAPEESSAATPLPNPGPPNWGS